MLSPLLCWDTGDTGLVRKPVLRNKFDTTTTGSSDDSLNLHKPPLKTQAHLKLPSISSHSSGDICTLLSSVDESDDKENDRIVLSSKNEKLIPSPRRSILSECNNRRLIDKIFECYDDPYAKLPLPTTPGPPTTPKPLLSPRTPISGKLEDYVPNEVKSAVQKAYHEGQKDFCHILQKNGIDPNSHFNKVFSTNKKSSKKVNFECSTPREFSGIEDYGTPLDKSNVTDTPLSGFKKLESALNCSITSPYVISSSFSPLPASHSDVSFSETCSPLKNIPADIKSTFLTGIVCYVEVRSGNENRTESVKEELRSLGAKVEKNFTKKVTHVVFKEGRVSTYLKAKKEGIPIVGVLWIEACKMVRGIADPAMHPPKRMQKYESILPFQTIKKRRIAILNPKSRVRKNLMLLCDESPTSPPSPRKTRSRKAVTEMKGIHPSKDSFERNCTKKLLYDEQNDGEDTSDQDIAGKENIYDRNLSRVRPPDYSSTDNSAEIREAAIRRRKSAPGKLISRKNAKREDIKAYFKRMQERITKDSSIERDISTVRKEFENLKTGSKEDDEEGIHVINDSEDEEGFPIPLKVSESKKRQTLREERQINGNLSFKREDEGDHLPRPERKKRKLFDPNEIMIQSQSENEQSNIENNCSNPVLSYPIPVNHSTPKGPRTKANYRTQTSLKITVARKLHEQQKKKLDLMDTDSSPSGMWFVEKSEQPKKKQQPPSITFTRIAKGEMEKYTAIVHKLGKYTIDENVSRWTTHVVSNGPSRTIKIIKGIARGCWLVDIQWVIESEAFGKWLPHENYSLFHAFPAAAHCCRIRRGLKTTHVIDIFKEAGKIYVSRKLKSSPSFKDIEEILRICSATLTSSSQDADLIVGRKGKNSGSKKCVTVKWVFDSVTLNTLCSVDDYLEDVPESQCTVNK